MSLRPVRRVRAQVEEAKQSAADALSQASVVSMLAMASGRSPARVRIGLMRELAGMADVEAQREEARQQHAREHPPAQQQQWTSAAAQTDDAAVQPQT